MAGRRRRLCNREQDRERGGRLHPVEHGGSGMLGRRASAVMGELAALLCSDSCCVLGGWSGIREKGL